MGSQCSRETVDVGRRKRVAVKRCIRCDETKALEEFHRDSKRKDGRHSYCKECTATKAKKWREENPEKKRAQNKRWHEANPKRVAELRHRWRRENQRQHRETQARHRKRHPEKARARAIVLTAVHDGRLEKPAHCESCQELTLAVDLHGHHEDYSKPYEVQWLCRACHMDTHGGTFRQDLALSGQITTRNPPNPSATVGAPTTPKED